MSFIEQIASMNESGTMAIRSENPCTYSDFVDAMLTIQAQLCEAVNIYTRAVNEDAISSLLEDGTNLPVAQNSTQELEKEKLSEKLKKMWRSIIEWFFRSIDGIYDALYEQLVLHTKKIEKHKDQIMKNTVVYQKAKQTVSDVDGKIIDKRIINIGVPSVKGFSKLLSPNWVSPMLDMGDLKKFTIASEKLNQDEIYKHYKNEILGNECDIDIDDINSSKIAMLDGMKARYEDLKKRKQEIIRINTKRQNPSSSLTPEEVQNLQKEALMQAQSLRMYNKVTIEYCKTVSSILRMYIQKDDKEEK